MWNTDILAIWFGLALVLGVAILAAISRRRLAGAVNRERQGVKPRIAALEEERRTRDAILSSLTEGVVLVDRDGAILYRNNRAAELLGTPLRRDGRPLSGVLRSLTARPGDEAAHEISEMDAVIRQRTVHAIGVPLKDHGEVLIVLRDVTEARRVESVRREFVANASHELKTPAASIRALAETIGDTARGDPVATSRFVRQLEREALRLSEIVSDLLDLSRLESEAGDQAEVHVAEIVAEEVTRRADRAKKAGVSIDFSSPTDDLVVLGNARDLSLLVRNLLDNAIQYTSEGGEIEVSVARQDGEAVLAVRDTGIGIPSRDQERIFERFYRVDRARSRETGGTGLGLSIVKHVAENHGGSVSVDSELGRGSTFTVRIPSASG